MIPDNVLEECLNWAEKSTKKFRNNLKTNYSFEEIKPDLSKEYDNCLFECLQKKNYAQYLKPENKGNLTTTKIELRKAECIRSCKKLQ